MNKVILQVWEVSDQKRGNRPDGCSIHIDPSVKENFISLSYKDRCLNDIPQEYDRVVGDPVDVFVSDDLFSKIKEEKSIRLFEYEMNNLLTLQEIITKYDN